jgi:hypothetical protein
MDMAEDAFQKAWMKFVGGLEDAGRQMDAYIKDLDPVERADGYRALSRMLAANIEKVEMDGSIPEIVHDNTPNHKWFMDNPDGIYWHLMIDPQGRYRIRGNMGDACYTSFIVYNRGAQWFQTDVCSSLGGDEIETDEEGNFDVMVGGEKPETGAWLPLEQGAWLIWIRQLFEDVHKETHGWFDIDDLEGKAPVIIEPEKFMKRLGQIGEMIKQITAFTVLQARTEEKRSPNQVRRWKEMQAGAVYTLPGFDYMRGAWRLEPDQALVLEGRAVSCRHWNIVLYSRFLNSLEHRRRPVSLTGSRVVYKDDGSFRLVIAHENPGVPNWLDTEGRPFGMFVIRWLFPERETVLPTARVVNLDELRSNGDHA